MVTSGLVLLAVLCLTSGALTSAQQNPEPEAATKSVRLLDRFDNRYPDGSYEYRFELDDGTSRYERGYFVKIDDVKTLMVVGYYSYRMTDGRFITVFYNADQFGYRQNQSITPQVYPNLPRSIEVPMATAEASSSQSRSEAPLDTISKLGTTTPRGAVAGTRGKGRY
ncbi:hypothetical protein KR074_002391 [Drosophila pseudoananassae]|nr:hypothetical protein KR074_002391 [Drosophila pseudoananassae]